jgi:hypothetical protein
MGVLALWQSSELERTICRCVPLGGVERPRLEPAVGRRRLRRKSQPDPVGTQRVAVGSRTCHSEAPA